MSFQAYNEQGYKYLIIIPHHLKAQHLIMGTGILSEVFILPILKILKIIFFNCKLELRKRCLKLITKMFYYLRGSF